MQDYTLTNHDIDVACHEVEIFCERANGEKRDILRTRLAVEEILLKYQRFCPRFHFWQSFQYDSWQKLFCIAESL